MFAMEMHSRILRLALGANEGQGCQGHCWCQEVLLAAGLPGHWDKFPAGSGGAVPGRELRSSQGGVYSQAQAWWAVIPCAAAALAVCATHLAGSVFVRQAGRFPWDCSGHSSLD